jgi:hypothetical protein
MPELKEIDVVMLKLDLDNLRIIHAKSQNDALKAMVQVQGKKIVEMATDIWRFGLSPMELVTVTKPEGEEDFYTVIEGNRRVTAIRLLENPELAGDSKIEKAINEAKKKYPDGKKVTSVVCSIIPDRETGMMWVDRKHGSGLGGESLQRWGYVENTIRKAERGEYEKWYAAVCHVRENGHDLPNIERDMAVFEIGTIIERFFGHSYLKNGLGVEISSKGTVSFDNGDTVMGSELLSRILNDLVSLRPDTTSYYDEEPRENFLKDYDELSVKKKAGSKASANGGSGTKTSGSTNSNENKNGTDNNGENNNGNGEDEKGKGTKKRPARRRNDRKTLAPKDKRLTLYIHQDRINDLYHDLRKLDVTDQKGMRNVGAVMLRVFLDLTLTHFLEDQSVPLDKDSSNRKKTSWRDIGVPLPNKLKSALNYIDPEHKEKNLKEARQALASDFSHSLHLLHEQVHDLEASTLTHKETIQYWDRYHPLFQKIYEILDEEA